MEALLKLRCVLASHLSWSIQWVEGSPTGPVPFVQKKRSQFSGHRLHVQPWPDDLQDFTHQSRKRKNNPVCSTQCNPFVPRAGERIPNACSLIFHWLLSKYGIMAVNLCYSLISRGQDCKITAEQVIREIFPYGRQHPGCLPMFSWYLAYLNMEKSFANLFSQGPFGIMSWSLTVKPVYF